MAEKRWLLFLSARQRGAGDPPRVTHRHLAAILERSTSAGGQSSRKVPWSAPSTRTFAGRRGRGGLLTFEVGVANWNAYEEIADA
jgi:hypothetical protein